MPSNLQLLSKFSRRGLVAQYDANCGPNILREEKTVYPSQRDASASAVDRATCRSALPQFRPGDRGDPLPLAARVGVPGPAALQAACA